MRRLLFALLLPLASLSAQAQSGSTANGDLAVLPVRVTLEGRSRATEIMLRNAGKQAATYRILFTEMEMGPDGQLKPHDKQPGEITASDLIRISPRQVTLQPGEIQTVRLQVRKPENLPDGEYRSHLLMEAIPPTHAPSALPDDNPQHSVSLDVTTIMGISIPVIVRQGSLAAKVTLQEARLEPPQQGAPLDLSLKMVQAGQRSVRGVFQVSVDSGGHLKPGKVLAEEPGIPIYHNTPFRTIHLGLEGVSAQDLQGTRLKVSYRMTEPQEEKPSSVTYLKLP
nr:fimbria/pilus periplasmic chaperone [uncultured Holophaga sp.]